MLKTAFENIKKSLCKWLVDASTGNIPVSGSMPQQKAKDFAVIPDAEKFVASSGWLQSLKHSFNIVVKTVSGESEDANEASIRKCLEEE